MQICKFKFAYLQVLVALMVALPAQSATITNDVRFFTGGITPVMARIKAADTPQQVGGRIDYGQQMMQPITNGFFWVMLDQGRYTIELLGTDRPIGTVIPPGNGFYSLWQVATNLEVFGYTNPALSLISSRVLKGANMNFSTNDPGAPDESLTISSTGSGGGAVDSLNNLIGDLNLASGDGTVAIAPSGTTIDLSITNLPASRLTGTISLSRLPNTGTAGTYTKTTFNAQGLETSGASAVLASADFANQGMATTLLHGNAAGNPSFGSVVENDFGFTDVTTANASTSAHGLAPKGDNNGSHFLNGQLGFVGLTLAGAQFANQGTVTTVLHGNASGNPSFGSVVENDLSLSDVTTANVSTSAHGFAPKGDNNSSHFLNGLGSYSTVPLTGLPNTGTAGTYTKVTFNAQGLETSGSSAVLASSDFANQGTTTTLLHGNASGNPSFGSVVESDFGFTDVTTANASTSAHGLAPKGDNSAVHFLNGQLGFVGLTLAGAQFANQGTTTTLLHGNAAGNPSFGAVVENDLSLSDVTTANVSTSAHGFAPKADNSASHFLNGQGSYSTVPLTALPNTGTAGTYTKVTFNAQGLETSGTSATLASSDFANQGTTTTLLHGNASGNPSFGSVVENDFGFTDVTTANATTSAHGLLPKGDNSAVHFLNGQLGFVGLTLAGAQFANQGTTTTVLHGNASGNPSFGSVVENDLSLSDVTTANVSTSAHGFAPKGDNIASHFLNGQGSYTSISWLDSVDIPMGAWFTNNLGDGASLTPASALSITNAGDGFAFASGSFTNDLRIRFGLQYGWDLNSVKLGLVWVCSGTNNITATNLVVSIKSAAVGAGDDLSNLSFGTAVRMTNNVNIGAWKQGTEGVTAALTVGNSPAANKDIIWEIQRQSKDGGDTETNVNLILARVRVYYTKTNVTAFPTSSP